MRALKFAGFAFLFLLFLVWFLPKENLYYFAEKKLSNYGVTLNNESVKDAGFTLNVENVGVSFVKSDFAGIEQANILPFFIYNHVVIKNTEIAKNFQKFMPNKIDKIDLKYTLLFPTKIWINIEGEFGKIGGSYGVFSKNLQLVLKEDNNFSAKHPLLYSNFKDREGELVCEFSF